MPAQRPSVAAPGLRPSNKCGVGLRFNRVYKRYGMVFALRDLTLEVAPGEFTLLRGPNGSGKTTLLRVSALLSRPTSGGLEIVAANPEPEADLRRKIGFVGHQMLLYEELTGIENLRFFARLYGVRSESVMAKWLRAAELWPRRNDLVRTYSRGMRQRLSLARALLHEPQLLLLDEPTTGLDQAGMQWLVQLLAEFKAAGSTVLASTHSQDAINKLATRTISLAAGSLVADTAGCASDPKQVRPLER